MAATLLKHSFLQIWDNVAVLFCGNFAVTTIALLVAIAVEQSPAGGSVPVFLAIVVGTIVIVDVLLLYAAYLHHHLSADADPFDWLRTSSRVIPAAMLASSTLLAVPTLAWHTALSAQSLPDTVAWLVLVLISWTTLLVIQITSFGAVFAAMGVSLGRALETAVKIALARPGLSAGFLAIALLLMLTTFMLLPGPGGALVVLRNLLQFHLRAEQAPQGTSWRELMASELALHQRLDARSIVFPWRR